MITRANQIVPELLADAMKGAFAGATIMQKTGAAISTFTLPTEARGGDTLKVPNFGIFGEMEDTPEGTPLTPEAPAMSSDTTTVVHSGKAFQMTTWAQIAAAYADRYAEAARQVAELARRRIDRGLIDAASAAGLPAAQLLDVWNAATPKTLDYDTFVTGKLGFGDEQDDIAGLAVHSNVYGDLLKLKDSYGRPLLIDSARSGELPIFLGVPLFVSDRMPIDLTDVAHPKYTSLLLKRGALVFWGRQAPNVTTLPDPPTDSEIVATHMYWTTYRWKHLAGWSKPGVVQMRHN